MNTFLKLGKITLNSRFIKSVAIKHLTVKRQETRGGVWHEAIGYCNCTDMQR